MVAYSRPRSRTETYFLKLFVFWTSLRVFFYGKAQYLIYGFYSWPEIFVVQIFLLPIFFVKVDFKKDFLLLIYADKIFEVIVRQIR